MSELTDDRLRRYVAMLEAECAYKGPCKDKPDGCDCSAVDLDTRHMLALRTAASTSTEGAGEPVAWWVYAPNTIFPEPRVFQAEIDADEYLAECLNPSRPHFTKVALYPLADMWWGRGY